MLKANIQELIGKCEHEIKRSKSMKECSEYNKGYYEAFCLVYNYLVKAMNEK